MSGEVGGAGQVGQSGRRRAAVGQIGESGRRGAAVGQSGRRLTSSDIRKHENGVCRAMLVEQDKLIKVVGEELR